MSSNAIGMVETKGYVAALAAADPRCAPGQLGHDHLRIDSVSQHMAVVTIAGNDAVLAHFQRRLQPDRNRFLSDIEVAETADQAEAVQLPGLFFKPPDQEHLPVEFEELLIACGKARIGLMRNLQAAESEIFLTVNSLGRHFAARNGLGQCRIPRGLDYPLAYKANCARGKPSHTNLMDRFAGWIRKCRNVTR